MPGRPARLTAIVIDVDRYICTGSAVFLAEPERRGRARRPHDHVALLEASREILRDQAPQLLRLDVVGVVVAVREHVGADQDAALHLGPEALARGSSRTCRRGRRTRARGSRSARRRSARGCSRLPPARARSRPAPTASCSAASLPRSRSPALRTRAMAASTAFSTSGATPSAKNSLGSPIRRPASGAPRSRA